MMDNSRSSQVLTEGQQAIVDVITELGKATRLDLQTHLKQYAHSTIDTNLRELTFKNVLTVQKETETRNQFSQSHSVPVNVYRLS